jgi:CheY-like chemotaxis protein
MADEHGTALSSAHERFLGSLPTRARELSELVRGLEQTPGDERLLEQLRRRVHALYASGQLFGEPSLLDALQPVLAELDAARDGQRALSAAELSTVSAFCKSLEPEGERESSSGSDRQSVAPPRWTEPFVASSAGGASVADPQLVVTQTVSGTLAAPADVIALLVVATHEVESEVRASLPTERCEVTSTPEPDTAALVIDHVAPDLVLVESGFLCVGGERLSRALRGERRALIALVPEQASDAEAQLARTFADAVMRLPLGKLGVVERLQRIAGLGARAPSALELIQGGTVDEIAASVADEVRRGILGALRSGKGERVDLGDKSELLAATWSAVSRIRAHIVHRAHGRVRYDEPAFAGAPMALALRTDDPTPTPPQEEVSLAGLRVLIADDDPAVCWFFSELVRDAGGVALEARDGAQALELMRRRAPDLLVSDILMPEVDGFTLCRELRRDLALAHVPVILLSWKEDFLQRMRELDAGASGYLRKEAPAAQVLAMFAEALRPRRQLCALLDSGDEVRGRVDSVGAPLLLSLVASRRPAARVRVRDAWNLFEVDLRDGAIAVTATAADGSFIRGEGALRQLMGVDVGRFTVGELENSLRGALPSPVPRALADAVHHLSGMLDSLCDTRLMEVLRVDLDDEVLRPLLAATPTALAELVSRLRAGQAPKDLVVAGVVSARDLEQQLRELARRGAVRAVLGEGGVDLAAAARDARRERPSELLHMGSSSRPPPPMQLVDLDLVQPSDRPSALPPELPMALDASELEVLDEVLAMAASTPPGAPSSIPAAPDSVPPLTSLAPLSAPASHSPPPLHSPRPLAITERPDAASSWLTLAITIPVMALLGYAGIRFLLPRAPAGSAALPAVQVIVPTRDEVAARPLEPPPSAPFAQSDAPIRPVAEPSASPQSSPEGSELRLLPFVDRSRGIAVGEDEGLLVIEYEGSGQAPRVRVLDRELGPAPVAAAVPAGRHQVELLQGTRMSFRAVTVRAGATTILDGRPVQ